MTPVGPPSSKWWETLPCNRAIKPSPTEAFSQDSDLVREAREAFFSKHSYNFIKDWTHGLSEVFWQMATNAELLGTSIHEIQASWMGPKELKQANYALRALPKGLKFLHVIPPSESPKVMGLMGIYNPDDLCCFSGITHCPWCGKEGQNQGIMVNHLPTVHCRLGLVCNRCHDCPSITSDHSLPTWLAGLSPNMREKSQWVSLIWVIIRRNKTASAENSNKEVKTEMVYPRLSYWEYPYLLL